MRSFCGALVLVLSSSLVAGQVPSPANVPVPANIKVEGMPAIPQSIADGLARYASFRQAQLIAWHPTKREILITTSFASNPSVPQIHLVDGPGGDRHQLTWIKNGVSVGVDASFDPDGNSFIFVNDPAGGELRSLYRYDLGTGETSLVIESKTRYAPVWSHQGKWLAYDSAERNGKDRDLYVIQPADPKTKRRLGEFDGPFEPNDWSPDGTSLLATEVLGNSENYLWIINAKTDEKRAITSREGTKMIWSGARFTSDGRKILAVGDRGGEIPRLWRCDLATGTWTALTPDDVALDVLAGFDVSPDGQTAALVVDRGSSNELQLLDLTRLKLRRLPAMPKGTVSRVSWRRDSQEVGFTLASTKSQGDVYSIDVSRRTVSRWTNSETTFNPDVLPAAEIIEWRSFDGEAISGVLYRAAAKFRGPRPVLINIHGGPDQRIRPFFLGRSNYLLNEMGVSIIYPNVRGSLGFGRKFEQLDNGRGRDGPVKDIGALLDWITTRPDFDKSRIVLGGASYGGWLALEAGIVYNDRIRGILEGAGITNLVTYLEQTDAARRENRRQEYGDERDPQMREFLLSISPETRAADLKKPTLIVHPGKDPRVPVAQAQELVRALKANNATVWYIEVTDANHDNLSQLGGDYILYSWILFFKTFVMN